jgi:hypothetical protein
VLPLESETERVVGDSNGATAMRREPAPTSASSVPTATHREIRIMTFKRVGEPSMRVATTPASDVEEHVYLTRDEC